MATRAVLFDFGGTLYDYRSLARGDLEALLYLARSSGVEGSDEEIRLAYRAAMRRVFRSYLPRRYYLHRDLFRDALIAMLDSFGVAADDAVLVGHRNLLWQLHARDFRLREGVSETLAELRARGMHLGIVSNIDRDQLSHLGDLAGLADGFDSVLSSEEAGSCKPDGGIFDRALRIAGCVADDAIFVGDSLEQDVVGANRAGIRSVLLWHRGDRQPPSGKSPPAHVIRGIPEVLGLLDVG